jgi:putative ABC transport system permease protein
MNDIRYALRTLTHHRGFSLAVVMTMALGFGATTAIAALVHAVLLRQLPYRDAEQVVLLGHGGAGGKVGNLGFLTFADWRERTRAFEQVGAYRSWLPTLKAHGEAERITGMRVSWNYFRLLGVTPAVGRDFARDEDVPGRGQVVVISDALWTRRFGRDRRIVGRSIVVNDQPHTIVGVLGAAYEPLIAERYYSGADMWAPLAYDGTLRSACRGCQHLMAVGRLREGVSIAAARDDLQAVQAALRRQFPTEYAHDRVAVVPLRNELLGAAEPLLQVLAGAAAFVLLIACVNVTNLQLARARRREHELAIRAALGAGRARLVRHLLAESILLAVAGGIAGTVIATWGLSSVVALAADRLPRLAGVSVNARVAIFTLAVSLACGLLVGLAPAIRLSAFGLVLRLRAGERHTGDRSQRRLRRLLVVGEIALGLMLLVGAGLMVRTLDRLMRIDPGFDPRDVLTLQISAVATRFESDEQVLATFDAILSRVRGIPGVEAAALAGQVPLGGNMDMSGFHIEGVPRANPADAPSVERYAVTRDYFRVMRIPVLRGRLITADDHASAQLVVVIGETTARRLWPGEDPIGRQVRIGAAKSPLRTIVGVVGDVRHYSIAAPPTMQMYLPQAQNTDSFVTLVVRTRDDAAAAAPAVRRAIRNAASDVPVYGVATLEELVVKSVSERRFVMWLLSMFASLAFVLAAVGIYAVVAYAVTQRRHEMGIRIALGARSADILGLVVREGLPLIAAGVAAGVGGALLLTEQLETLLHDVSATDLTTFAAATAALSAVAVAAHLFPGWRATRVDPVTALRAE